MKVKIDDIIMALEYVNTGIDNRAYFNPKTKEIVYVGDCIDIGDEREEMYDEYISFPTKYDIHEYSIMEEFIETINDERLYNQLLISIHGKGAFRRFKDTCINFGIIDDWYKFRDKKYKDIAIKWCEENNIEFY